MMDGSIVIFIGFVLCIPSILKGSFWTTLPIIFYWLLIFLWSVCFSGFIHFSPHQWVPTLHINLSYQVDGLARLFASLISGIGVLIFCYALIYTQRYITKRKKLISLLHLFAVSMLILVLANDMVLLFIGWELTTISSYLLIQFETSNKDSNRAAFTSLFVTIIGGLALLLAIVLLNILTGSFSIQTLLHTLVYSKHSSYLDMVLIFMMVAVATKSAQFPFYFWLPGAMKAPTPVSAYLHSATMVNAGIYLLARFHPLFAISPLWYPFCAAFGLSTMLISSVLSIFQDDLKALLAYTTIFALGAMVYLLGSKETLAIEAFAIFIVFHAIYKAAAFMIVGTIDQEYKTRLLSKLQGIAKKRYVFSICIIIIFGAMAGLPPFFGFTAKELIYEAKLASNSPSYVLIALSILSSVFIAAASIKAAWSLLCKKNTMVPVNSVKYGYILSLILSIIIIGMSFFSADLQRFVESAVVSIIRNKSSVFVNPNQISSTALSLLTVVVGVLLAFVFRGDKYLQIKFPSLLNPNHLFEQGLNLLLRFGGVLTKYTQGRSFTFQLQIILSTMGLITLLCMLKSFVGFHFSNIISSIKPTDYLIFSLFLFSSFWLVFTNSFLLGLVSLSLIGLTFAFFFTIHGAVDLAITQLLVEVLAVIIMLTSFAGMSITYIKEKTGRIIFNIIISILFGALITVALTMLHNKILNEEIQKFFIANSLPLGFGKNIVNVILVDFRALDTLGEGLVIIGTAVGIAYIVKKIQKLKGGVNDRYS